MDHYKLNKLQTFLLLIISEIPEECRSGEEFFDRIHSSVQKRYENRYIPWFVDYTLSILVRRRLLHAIDENWRLTEAGQTKVAQIKADQPHVVA